MYLPNGYAPRLTQFVLKRKVTIITAPQIKHKIPKTRLQFIVRTDLISANYRIDAGDDRFRVDLVFLNKLNVETQALQLAN